MAASNGHIKLADAPPTVIFGAGKTGRGFLAHICARAGRRFVLVDRDRDLIDALIRAKSYPVVNLRTGIVTCLSPAQVFHVDDDEWMAEFAKADLCFTAVFGNNLAMLGKRLACALSKRDASAPMTIITCENLAHAAAVLRASVVAEIPAKARDALLTSIGFVEGIVLKTCLGPPEEGDRLGIRAQDLFRLPCDADAFTGAPPALPDLQPLPRFEHQLVRKIYTYNCINAVISYLGARAGHRELSAAACDPAIDTLARQAGEEASRALVAEFHFDSEEQRVWVEDAIAKFRDPGIPDPIDRNAFTNRGSRRDISSIVRLQTRTWERENGQSVQRRVARGG